MDEERAQAAAQVIHRALEHATVGEADSWVNTAPYFLLRVSRAADIHPHLRAALQQRPCRQQIVRVGGAVALYGDGDALNYARPVSQMSTVQRHLDICITEFWKNMRKESVASWDVQAAADVVRACGALRESGAAPATGEELIAVQRAAVSLFSGQFLPLTVARTARAFAQQQVQLGEAKGALQEAAARTAHHMKVRTLEHVLVSFAKLGEELGPAREPLMLRLAEVSRHLNPGDLDKCLWACGELKVPPGKWSSWLLRRVNFVAAEFGETALQQVRASLQRLQQQGCDGTEMRAALQSVGGGGESEEASSTSVDARWMHSVDERV